MNLSARQLAEASCVDDVAAVLRHVGLPATALQLEITESVRMVGQSFTRRLPGDEELLAFIVQLARAIGATTVVEGVETRDQLDIVSRVGCDQAQGFFLSRPLAPDAAAEYLGALATPRE